jgi:hypothetical protein
MNPSFHNNKDSRIILAWCFFFSHRYHHRRRRRRHDHIAQIITTKSSEQILKDRFFYHLKDWMWFKRIRNINS